MLARIAKAGRGVSLALLATVAILSSGCLAAAAAVGAGGATAYAYYKGEVLQEYPASINDLMLATRDALRDLQLPIDDQGQTTNTAFFVCRLADQSRVRIDMESFPSPIPAEKVVTRVSVRVATFGDKPASERIHYHIGRYLAPKNGTTTTGTSTPDSGIQQTGGWNRVNETAPPPLADPKPVVPPPPK